MRLRKAKAPLKTMHGDYNVSMHGPITLIFSVHVIELSHTNLI